MKQMTLDELHQKQLQMLKDFDSFCKEHGLTYYLAYGTLIGAIRHKGFIPWDDDVDLWMSREDYDKLVSFDQINETLKIVTKENSQGYFHPYSYCNIADTETVMDEHLAKNPTGKGIFLDVFPLDVLPDDESKALAFMKKCRQMARIQSCCLYVQQPGIKGFIKRVIGKLLNWEKTYPKLQKVAVRYRGMQSQHVGVPIFVCTPYKGILKKQDFAQAIEWDFEGIKLSIPIGYDAILTRIYGDYMTPPPVAQQKGHHMVDYFKK